MRFVYHNDIIDFEKFIESLEQYGQNAKRNENYLYSDHFEKKNWVRSRCNIKHRFDFEFNTYK